MKLDEHDEDIARCDFAKILTTAQKLGYHKHDSLRMEQRRRDRIEYDRTHFEEQPKQWPRYCDQTTPWWVLQAKATGSGDSLEKIQGKTVSEIRRARSVPAPAFKITEQTPFEPMTQVEPLSDDIDRLDAAHWLKDRKSKLKPWDEGGATKIRWTTDLIKVQFYISTFSNCQ